MKCFNCIELCECKMCISENDLVLLGQLVVGVNTGMHVVQLCTSVSMYFTKRCASILFSCAIGYLKKLSENLNLLCSQTPKNFMACLHNDITLPLHLFTKSEQNSVATLKLKII